MRLAGPVENRLVAGSYTLDVYVREDREAGGMTVQGLRLLTFRVEGPPPAYGVVSVRAEVEPVLEDAVIDAAASCATSRARARWAAAGAARSSCST